MKALPGSIPVVVLAMTAIIGGVSSAGAAERPPGVILAEISGQHNYTELLSQPNSALVTERVSLRWTLTISGSNKTIEAGRDEPYFNLEGTVSETGGTPSIACTGNLSAAEV
jgi:hypothetical protein